MRLVSERTALEWPDEVGSQQARAALLYFADRFAELIEWAVLRCDTDGEPLSERHSRRTACRGGDAPPRREPPSPAAT
jgi:hypothetical protein